MIQYAVRATPMIQYDGTNSAEIVTMLESTPDRAATITSEASGVLAIFYEETMIGGGTNNITVSTGDWVSVWAEPIPAAQFDAAWIIKS